MLVLIAALAVFLTMILLTLVYYDLFQKQVWEDLHSYGMLLTMQNGVQDIQEVKSNIQKENLRITLIGADGKVEYDSEAEASDMENHSERPELREAWENGEGYAVRNSKTLAKATFYYAIRQEDNSILRIARDAGSIYSIFWGVLPSVAVVFAALLGISMVVAHFLTGKLMVPIEQLAQKLDGENDTTDYEELTPFIQMIQKQHRDIIKSAQIRQEFTANVSHELKTPLTAISGYAELLETGMASEKDVVHFAQGIHDSAKRLLTLIDDILRLSELDSTKELSWESVDLYELAKSCIELLTISAQKHRVTLSLQGESAVFYANRQMMEELLYNLCDNAIRYNKEDGSVTVTIKTNTEHICLEVADTGIGIPPEHQERIFERFYRVDKSRSKLTGGTGLGLAIVKHIVAKHHAQMQLESEPGKGTVIRVYFRPEYRQM